MPTALTDFKIVSMVEGEADCMVTVRFYEGKVVPAIERVFSDLPDTDISLSSVTRYRRSGFLREVSMFFPKGTTEKEIVSLLCQELKKDKSRTPIPQQTNA
jgi:hypothetical protein